MQKKINLKFCCLIIVILFTTALSFSQNKISSNYIAPFKPDDQALYDTIVYMDSVFFEAYNTCSINLDKYAAFYDDSIEFYHDQGGLSTSKKQIVEATKKNICGKVTRQLVKGSIEVYPIKNFGAIEIGFHTFHNNTQKENTAPKIGRFVIIWQHKNNEWKITRVVSLH